VIGASADADRGGHAILFNLRQGFDGPIYPVNPRYGEIDGLPCYASVSDVPDPVDLAIVFVPARAVPGVVAECARRGIPGVMIQSAGFAEAGAPGVRLQEELDEIRRDTGIRIWGPNCMGLVDAKRRHVFSFVLPSIWDEEFLTGEVSLVVQSGMLAAGFLVDLMTNGTMGISKACSIGNKADVDECDILEYLVEDPDTGVIALYLESIADGRRFMELCRRCPKPIVVLKGGKSASGAKAAMSHTASMAGDGAVARGALAQAGVIEAFDFFQMMDFARTLAVYPRGIGRARPAAAVITFSGAAGIVAADFVETQGLRLAELSEPALTALRNVFPPWMPVSNPVDLWPAVELNGADRAYGEAMAAVCADPAVDMVFLHFFTGGRMEAADFTVLARAARDAGKPLVCWFLGPRADVLRFQDQARLAGVPSFREIGRAVECLAAVAGRGDGLRRNRQPTAVFSQKWVLSESVQALLDGAAGPLDEHRSKQVLAAAGIPTVAECIVNSPDEAGRAATRLEAPVVVKGLAAGQVHKTELGLVRLGIGSPAQAAEAYSDLIRKMSGRGEVLVQRQVSGGVEIIAGFLRDPQFGACVLVGMGGVLAEVLADRVFGVAPFSPAEALALIARLKSQRLLDGYRGAAHVDRDALAAVLVRLGELGAACPRIREIDVNPLIVTAGKPVAVDATIVLSEA
jgi:acetyltransferase